MINPRYKLKMVSTFSTLWRFSRERAPLQCTIVFVTTRMQRRPNPCTILCGVCKRVCDTLFTFANGPAVIAPLVTRNLRACALQKTSMGVIDKAMLATQEAGIRSQQHPNSFYPLELEMVGRNRT